MVADEEFEEGTVVAVLRSDTPHPLLSIWDATLDTDIVPEYAEYTGETGLYAHLLGSIGVSKLGFHIELQELAELIVLLREVTGLNLLGMEWSTYQKTLEIRLSVQIQ